MRYERGPKGFDDISVDYDPPRYEAGRHINREHFQCKWHVQPGTFTGVDLCLPRFINAKTKSFLELARDTYRDQSENQWYQVHLATNWTIDKGDALAAAVRSNDGRIDLSRVFDGSGARSKMGKLRSEWLTHLQVDEEELTAILQRLVLLGLPSTLVAIDQWLDAALIRAGLEPNDKATSSREYDDLARKLLSQGRVEFDRKAFRELCENEKKLSPVATKAQPMWTVGIRSFLHKFDNIDDRCDAVLDLTEHFDRRYPKSVSVWNDLLLPQLDQFLTTHAGQYDSLRLVLDAHTSLAYAAGTVLDAKAGKTLSIEQRVGAKQYWSYDDTPVDSGAPGLDFSVQGESRANTDIYCGVGITHDVSDDMQRYVVETSQGGCFQLVATITGGASNSAVENGAHAWRLSEELVQQLRQLGAGPGGPHVHLFIAAPNTFTFFLGQHSRAIGPVTVYEFDFDRGRGAGYAPGFSTL